MPLTCMMGLSQGQVRDKAGPPLLGRSAHSSHRCLDEDSAPFPELPSRRDRRFRSASAPGADSGSSVAPSGDQPWFAGQQGGHLLCVFCNRMVSFVHSPFTHRSLMCPHVWPCDGLGSSLMEAWTMPVPCSSDGRVSERGWLVCAGRSWWGQTV